MRNSRSGPVPVVVMGLGYIGQEIARSALLSPELDLVGAVDSNPALIGKRLGEVLGQSGANVRVSSTLGEARGHLKRPVLLHATGSRLKQIAGQLFEAIEEGFSVVSTCEELAFPYLKNPDLAEKLERAATKAGVSIVGTGVNPGFVLDRLVATVGQACGEVNRVRAVRVVDARTRREALQRKIGAGLTEEEFDALAEKEQVGHVGLAESAALCALGLGLDCDDFEEELAPVVADEDIHGGAFVVRKGRVAGATQTVVGLKEGEEQVRLEVTIAVGAENPGDRIEIDGEPRISMEIRGGVPGDRATANLVVNAAPRLNAAEPGILTVLELPAGR